MDPVEAYGELIFGRRLRLRVLLWARLQTGTFNQSEAAKGVDYSSTGEVAKELERLVQLGMLRKFGRVQRVGPQNYMQVDHPGWAVVAAAQRAVDIGLPDDGLPEEDETEATPEPAPGLAGRGGRSHDGVWDFHSGKRV